MEHSGEQSSATMRELALFQVGRMSCALEISLVREIIKNYHITQVHSAPEYVKGVINLRGEIATVIDLRTKFSMDSAGGVEGMEIVVVCYGDEDIGLLVDNVRDVMMAEEKQMEPPPSNISGVTGIFFKGILKMENELVAVLNLDELLKKAIHSE